MSRLILSRARIKRANASTSRRSAYSTDCDTTRLIGVGTNLRHAFSKGGNYK